MAVAAGVALALGLMPSGASAAARMETIMQDDALLLHRPPAEVGATLDTMAGLGVDRVRATAVWSEIAPAADSRARPAFDAGDPAAYPPRGWARLDTLVRLATARGLALDLDVGFWAPLWATRQARPGRAVREIDAGELGHFARAVATRYSGAYSPGPAVAPPAAPSLDAALLDRLFGGGRPPPPAAAAPAGRLPAVRMYTVHNEPNHPGFLRPQWVRGRPRSAALYRRMVRSAYAAIKAVDPANVVLVGATSSIGGDDREPRGGVAPLRFLRELACVDARLRPLRDPSCRGYRRLPGDGWAHHPYSLYKRPDVPSARADEVSIADLSRLTGLLDRLAGRGRVAPGLRDVWLTEFGYETNDPVASKPFSAVDQARFLPWSEHLAWRNPRVRSFAQFLLRDTNTAGALRHGPRGRAFGSWQTGLLHEDGRPKPALETFRTAVWAKGETVWGHLRPARAALEVGLEARVSGRGGWRPAGRARTDERGFFTVRAAGPPGAEYRIRP